MWLTIATAKTVEDGQDQPGRVENALVVGMSIRVILLQAAGYVRMANWPSSLM